MNKEMIWDFWAKRYDRLWVQKFSLQPTRREILIYLKKILDRNKSYRILDVGCGIGQTLHEIQAEFKDYSIELFGIDFSQDMITRAKTMNKNISFAKMNVNNIEKLNTTFDIIICTHSLPYYDDQSLVLNKFSKLLNHSGRLLLAQASQNNFYDKTAMFFVKFTTGKAKYPSVKRMEYMTKNLFYMEEIIKIKEKFFMPSIYFFVLKGDRK